LRHLTRDYFFMDYFEELIELLDAEKKYDKDQHENLLLKSSLSLRKEKGVSWFPVIINQTELGRGDYLTITLHKTNDLQVGHQFRFGMPVAIFSNHHPTEDRINGIITFVNRETMRISLRVDELPDWSKRGKLGVDLLFDENSYKEMHTALIQAQAQALSTNDENGVLIRQLIGQESLASGNSTSETQGLYQNIDLNESQNQAIRHVLADNSITILHGPPGTGKTTTVIEAVQGLLKDKKQQILLVAPSNTAVDLLTQKLTEKSISVVRIGNPVRVSEELGELTLDAKVAAHPGNKEIKTLEKQARTFMDMAHQYKRSFGHAERQQRKALFTEAHKLREEIDKIQDFIVQDILNKVEVITATLVGSNHYTIANRKYETVIIDEAAQALEPACWIPILKGKSIVLAGDHCQLPPTVKSTKQIGRGLNYSLFEKLITHYPTAVSLLNVQYRMNQQIMNYPANALYKGELQAHPSVSHSTLINDDSPILFIDTAGAGMEENQQEEVISNPAEAMFLKMHLQELIQNLKINYTDDNFPKIGVISPYRGQATLLKELVALDEVLQPFSQNIQVQTIDSFQGQEKDIIYISLTRSNHDQQIGFLADVRRMNVAMTRAKKKLIIIGDSSTVGNNKFYKELIDYLIQIDQYHSAWEWDISHI